MVGRRAIGGGSGDAHGRRRGWHAVGRQAIGRLVMGGGDSGDKEGGLRQWEGEW